MMKQTNDHDPGRRDQPMERIWCIFGLRRKLPWWVRSRSIAISKRRSRTSSLPKEVAHGSAYLLRPGVAVRPAPRTKSSARSLANRKAGLIAPGHRCRRSFSLDFADGVLPLMVSYKWAIKQVEEARRTLALHPMDSARRFGGAIGLRDKASPQLKSVMEHLETFKAPVGQAIRALPGLGQPDRRGPGGAVDH